MAELGVCHSGLGGIAPRAHDTLMPVLSVPPAGIVTEDAIARRSEATTWP
jgi:hypothetical protein